MIDGMSMHQIDNHGDRVSLSAQEATTNSA